MFDKFDRSDKYKNWSVMKMSMSCIHYSYCIYIVLKKPRSVILMLTPRQTLVTGCQAMKWNGIMTKNFVKLMGALWLTSKQTQPTNSFCNLVLSGNQALYLSLIKCYMQFNKTKLSKHILYDMVTFESV